MRRRHARERRKYDAEFREGAVRIVRETGKPIAEVARDLGIGAGTLGNWVKKDRLARGEESERTRVDPVYVRRLSSGRTPSCGWSVMSSLDEYGVGGCRSSFGLFVGNGEGRPRCLAT